MTMPQNRHGPLQRTVAFRAATEENGDGRTLEGYAAKFNSPTHIDSWEGKFDEQIAPGAFKKSLRESQPIVQWNHGQDPAVGQVPIGAIKEAKEDKNGLRFKVRMHANERVEPVREAVASGAVTGCSFRFTPQADEWRDAKGKPIEDDKELMPLIYGYHNPEDEDRLPVKRTIHQVKLHEFGPVAMPAYSDTSVGVRSADTNEGDREVAMADHARTMALGRELRRQAEEAEGERSGANDGDGDQDDTLLFDHFASDVPVREDGLPDVGDDEYEADGERAAKDPAKPYGDVTYADKGYQKDGKNRYPLDTKAHVKAAWSYINVQKNADLYSAADLKKVKSAIKAAAKEFDVEIDDEKKSAPEVGEARTEVPQTPEARDTGASEINQTRKVVTLKTKDEFEARNAEIEARLKAVAEETRDAALDDAQQTEWDTLVAERSTNDKKLAGIEERAKLLLDGARANPGKIESGQAPAFRKEVNPYDMDAIRAASNSPEDLEARLMDNAKRAIERAKYAPKPKGYKGEDEQTVASSLLETVYDDPSALAKRMLITGNPAYERAFSKFLRHGSDAFCDNEERQALYRAQTLGTNSSGGFAVPFQLDPSIILTNAGVVNPIRQLARQVQITGKQWEGVTSAGATATRGAEAATAPDSSITLAQPVISTNRVQAFIPFSYELDLTWNALRAELSMVLLDAKEREEDSFWNGDGTGTNPQGVIGYTTNLPTVAIATAATLVVADIYKTQTALAPRFDRNATFAANKGIYNTVRGFDTAGGAALWTRVGDGLPDQMMGDPAVKVSASSFAQSVPASGTVSNLLVYGDFSKYLIVDRIGMNVELIPQVFDASNANRPTGQRGLYAVWMNNGMRLVDTAFQVLQSK